VGDLLSFPAKTIPSPPPEDTSGFACTTEVRDGAIGLTIAQNGSTIELWFSIDQLADLVLCAAIAVREARAKE